MEQRTRNIQVKFYVDADELALIDEQVKAANFSSRGAYLRKTAIDGFVIHVDTTDIKQLTNEVNAVGRNINQLVKKVNAYGPSPPIIEDIQARIEDIWQLL